MSRNELIQYLETILLTLLGILFLIFPLVFTPVTTDALTLPKQILMVTVVIVGFILLGAKMIAEQKVRLRLTPLDVPILLFGGVVLVSSLFAVNRFDSLIAAVPFLFAILSYFLIVNSCRNESSTFFLLSSILTGASLASIITVLSYIKIFIFPFPIAQDQGFTPFGLLLDQAIYLAIVLPIGFYFAKPLFSSVSLSEMFLERKRQEEHHEEPKTEKTLVTGIRLGYAMASIIIVIGLALSVYELLTIRKPVILPYQTGFQVAFAAMSQDTPRFFQGLLFGSGYATFFTDFTRFKQASFNVNPTLWAFTFFRSSSFLLELLTTLGVLGLGSFLFLVSKILRDLKRVGSNPVLPGLILAMILAVIFPLSFTLQAAFFLLLGLFASAQSMSHRWASDIELGFVALKDGILSVSSEHAGSRAGGSILPTIMLLAFMVIGIAIGYYFVRFVISDVLLQQSLVAAAQNNGAQTYDLQNRAIQMFPYRDANHRIFSQTNLALANSLAQNLPRNATPSSQTQQTIYTLIQQSINAARNSVTISPQTAINWENLSNIYRSLIGFGQNAANFAVISNQQAITLDPNNPQEYLNLGGIYYQLGLWDDAQRQFQIAINLKPDFANAYYNLGHALEQKNDLQQALVQYQIVRNLVANSPENLQKIDGEIKGVQDRIGSQAQASNQQAPQPEANQPPLEISTPSAKLPEQKPPVKIPPPGTQTATKSAR